MWGFHRRRWWGYAPLFWVGVVAFPDFSCWYCERGRSTLFTLDWGLVLPRQRREKKFFILGILEVFSNLQEREILQAPVAREQWGKPHNTGVLLQENPRCWTPKFKIS